MVLGDASTEADDACRSDLLERVTVAVDEDALEERGRQRSQTCHKGTVVTRGCTAAARRLRGG